MSIKNLNLNIIGKRKIWYLISAAILIAGIISFAIQGFNLGIDFTGGSYLQLTFYDQGTATDDAAATADEDATDEDAAADDEAAADEDTTTDEAAVTDETDTTTSDVEGIEVSMEDLRATVNEYVSHTPSIQYDETNKAYVIRTDLTEETDVNDMLDGIESEIGAFQVDRNELVGPTIGNELTRKAILALAIASVLMLIYITVRFQLYFGIASIIALVHDALIVMSVFTLFQFEITSSFIAAILTVIGYSINASIIVFDRVRENKPNYKPTDLANLMNDSISATFARSVNTTLTTLFTLFALIIFGGDTTKIFILAMIIGIIGGFYSSVCLSGSIYYDLQNHFGNKNKDKGKKKKQIA